MTEQLNLNDAPRQRPIERVTASLLNEHPHPPVRLASGRWSCCGGYGEHFSLCDWATWERRA